MGRPQGLAPVLDRLPAVLTAYYGGPHQGPAVADAPLYTVRMRVSGSGGRGSCRAALAEGSAGASPSRPTGHDQPDRVLGVTNAGGKLPVTLPRHVGQVPTHHSRKTGSGYRRTIADINNGYLD